MTNLFFELGIAFFNFSWEINECSSWINWYIFICIFSIFCRISWHKEIRIVLNYTLKKERSSKRSVQRNNGRKVLFLKTRVIIPSCWFAFSTIDSIWSSKLNLSERSIPRTLLRWLVLIWRLLILWTSLVFWQSTCRLEHFHRLRFCSHFRDQVISASILSWNTALLCSWLDISYLNEC